MTHVMSWIKNHLMLSAVLGAILALFAGCATQRPSTEREWYRYLARTPQVEMDDARFSVRPVSDWTYDQNGPVAESYGEATFALDELRRVWFMLEPQPGSQLAAHTLLLFEFEGDRLLGLTIEARREAHEDYSAFLGLWNTYELAYVWASARDLLVRRAVMLDHDVFVYPVAISDAQARALLMRVLDRTHALETAPRFYNTVFSNCTNELAKAADLDWTPEFVLTGRSDEYLFARGILPGATFEEAHARSDIGQWLRAWNAAPTDDFDAALLSELRARNGL